MALFIDSQVHQYFAEGIPGRLVNENPHVYTVLNYLAGGEVKIASFVWLNSDDNPRVVNTGTGVPFGFVTTLYDYYIRNRENDTFMALENERVTIVRQADIWAQSAAAVTVGQKVFANLTTGAVSTGAAGATVSGAIETSFIVKYVSPDSDNLFIMSNMDPVDGASIDARLAALESAGG